jgi:hypothetical protein
MEACASKACSIAIPYLALEMQGISGPGAHMPVMAHRVQHTRIHDDACITVRDVSRGMIPVEINTCMQGPTLRARAT